MKLDPTHTVEDALRAVAAEGATVELRLNDGHSLGGKIGGVGEHACLVETVTGKEFFDAWVRLESIVAIEARVRG